MGKSTNPLTFIASVEIAQKLRVAIVPGTTTEPPEVAIAGVGVLGIGVNDYLTAITKDCAVEPYNKAGSLEMMADGVIGEGAEVYPAAGGKISATPAGVSLGKALEAATADGDIIEILCSDSAVMNSQVLGATIATTGDSDAYIVAPKSGIITGIDFSGVDALAAHDTNYITFTVTNLGQDGTGSDVVLAATDVNTTKATGGSALVANGKRSLDLTATLADLAVVEGDRLFIRAAASGTLANTVTFPNYSLNIA